MADDSEKFELVPPENDPPVDAPVQSCADATIESSDQGGDAGGNGATSSMSFIGLFEKTEKADVMMERGLKAMQDQDYTAAIKCFNHALNSKVSQYGKSAVECCDAYHKYGRALYFKALLKSPLPMAGRQPTVWESQQEGEESEADLAWKILKIAWEIVENTDQNQPATTKIPILRDLADVAQLRGDAESSVHYHGKALSILEGLLEPDNILVAVFNYRMSNYLENGREYEKAISYCEKAISICNYRSSSTRSLQRGKPAEQDPTPYEEAEIQKDITYAETFKNKLQHLQHIVMNPGSRLVTRGLSTSTISSPHTNLATGGRGIPINIDSIKSILEKNPHFKNSSNS